MCREIVNSSRGLLSLGPAIAGLAGILDFRSFYDRPRSGIVRNLAKLTIKTKYDRTSTKGDVSVQGRDYFPG